MIQRLPTPLRLLMTTDTVGGVWDYAVMLCAEVAALHDARILLVSMGPAPSEAQRAASARVPGLDLLTTSFALEWMPDSLPDLHAAGRVIAELVTKHRPHLVHFNQHCFGSLSLPVPAIVVSHSDSLSWQYYQWGSVDPHVGWDAYRQIVRAGLRGASAVVAPTAFVAEALHALYVPDLPVRVIPNGASLEQGVEPRPANARRPIAAMGAGRVWDSAKNLFLLAEAAALLPPAPAYRVEIAGSVAAPHGDCAPVDRYSAVSFLGQVPRSELHTRLTHTRVFVAPARYEPFGLSLVEAALAGCALVASDIPSFHEVWGETALYISTDDAAGMAATLAGLLEDDVGRQQRADAARARALCHYTTQAMAARYLDLYRDLL